MEISHPLSSSFRPYSYLRHFSKASKLYLFSGASTVPPSQLVKATIKGLFNLSLDCSQSLD